MRNPKATPQTPLLLLPRCCCSKPANEKTAPARRRRTLGSTRSIHPAAGLVPLVLS